MRLNGSEYLDIRAASPGPFKTAELAGLVKAVQYGALAAERAR